MRPPGDGTVGKALDVLDRVTAFERPVRFTEILADVAYPKATLYRLLQTLVSQRMLAYSETHQTYAPGLRLVRMAYGAWNNASLGPLARPLLDRLSERIGQTIHLAQLDHGHVLYVDKRNASRPIEMFSAAGKVGPAYCTGVGKAMLAFLPEPDLISVLSQQSFHRFTENTITSPEALCSELEQVRTTGHAHDREEHEPGIICASVPILADARHPIGALSVTSTTANASLDDLTGYVPELAEAAEKIAAEAVYLGIPN